MIFLKEKGKRKKIKKLKKKMKKKLKFEETQVLL